MKLGHARTLPPMRRAAAHSSVAPLPSRETGRLWCSRSPPALLGRSSDALDALDAAAASARTTVAIFERAKLLGRNGEQRRAVAPMIRAVVALSAALGAARARGAGDEDVELTADELATLPPVVAARRLQRVFRIKIGRSALPTQISADLRRAPPVSVDLLRSPAFSSDLPRPDLS